MTRLCLLWAIALMTTSLTAGPQTVAAAPPLSGPPYDLQITRVMYRPGEPFHITDVRYPDKTDFETRTVEILRPYQGSQPLENRPVVLFVHGGGWVDEYADWYTDALTPTLTVQQGWVVVNVDYRLTSDQVYLADSYPANPTKAAWHPDNVDDVAAALDWTVQNIASYGGDTRNIFLFGHSAGGHLVSLAATHPDYRALRRHMRGVISLSGAYELATLNAFIFDPLLDQTIPGGHTDDAALDEASPDTYVVAGETLPSFYVLHCQLDLPSLADQAIAFRTRMQGAGFDVEWDYLAGYNHVSEIVAIADSQATVTQKIVAYIEGHIREATYLPTITRQSVQ